VIFLMAPGPPFPSIISELLMCSGRILGKRVSVSRQYALKSLAGATATANSFSKVMTPILTWDSKRLRRGGEILLIWKMFLWCWNKRRRGSIYSMKLKVMWCERITYMCRWPVLINSSYSVLGHYLFKLNNLCPRQINHPWNHIKFYLTMYALQHFGKS